MDRRSKGGEIDGGFGAPSRIASMTRVPLATLFLPDSCASSFPLVRSGSSQLDYL